MNTLCEDIIPSKGNTQVPSGFRGLKKASVMSVISGEGGAVLWSTRGRELRKGNRLDHTVSYRTKKFAFYSKHPKKPLRTLQWGRHILIYVFKILF